MQQPKNYGDEYAQLLAVKMLDQVNIDLIEKYVIEDWIYRKAIKEIESKGLTYTTEKGEIKANPARRIASDALKNIIQIAREFGLTPSTSQKIIIPNSEEPNKKGKPKKLEFDL